MTELVNEIITDKKSKPKSNFQLNNPDYHKQYRIAHLEYFKNYKLMHKQEQKEYHKNYNKKLNQVIPYVRCEYCNKEFTRTNRTTHNRSDLHKNNVNLFNDIELCKDIILSKI